MSRTTGNSDEHDGPPYPINFGHLLDDMPRPIVAQPRNGIVDDWMTRRFPNCPPGLEYLMTTNQLRLHQKFSLLEAFTCWTGKDEFCIRNSFGYNIYQAKEESNCLARNTCGLTATFNMKLFDTFKREVVSFYHPFTCTCCKLCKHQMIEVFLPSGTPIGLVYKEYGFYFPTFAVKNAQGETVLRIESPFFSDSWCCKDVVFPIVSADYTVDVGKIIRKWSGWPPISDTNYQIIFPLDMDVTVKAVTLGACFLINNVFFGNNI